MNKDLTLVILAAGLGSRYGGLKQIDPLGPDGEILIDYSIYDAHLAGFDRVVFIIKEELADTFKEVIGNRAARLMEVRYAFQGQTDLLPGFFTFPTERGTKPWGTSHALLCAKEATDTNFAVINADDFYGRESYEILANALRVTNPADSDFFMAGYVLKNTLSENGFVSRGVCEADGSGFLSRITERTKIGYYDGAVAYLDEDGRPVPVSADSLVSLNMWGFTPKIFDILMSQRDDFFKKIKNPLKDEFMLPTSVGEAMDKGEANVKVLPTPALWHGVTYPEDREKVRAILAGYRESGRYPALR